MNTIGKYDKTLDTYLNFPYLCTVKNNRAMKNNMETFGRMTHDLKRYVKNISKKYGAQVSDGISGSTYVRIGGRVLRISDHIGRNSSGIASIIVPRANTQDGNYILHIHSTGSIRIMTLQQVREFIRTFMLVSDVMDPIVNESSIEGVAAGSSSGVDTILGYPKDAFTEGQINHIRLFIKQNKSRNRLPK